MSKRFLFVISGIFFFILFIFFSYLVQKQIFLGFDFDTTVRLQNHIPRRLDAPFSFLSLLGSFEVSAVILIILLIIRRKFNGIIIFILFGLIHVFELFGKTFVKHPGPPFGFLRYDLGFNFPSAYVQPGSSYPSGHAARAFFLTSIVFLMIYRSKKLTPTQKGIIVCCLFGYDLLMCVSRVYLAEHWTTDIIGGTLSGLGLAFMSVIFL